MREGKGREGWERGEEGERGGEGEEEGRRRERGGEEPALPIKKSFPRSW